MYFPITILPPIGSLQKGQAYIILAHTPQSTKCRHGSVTIDLLFA